MGRQKRSSLDSLKGISVADSFDYQILNLTDAFYSDYPDPPYSEILTKGSRPYSCLLLQSHYDYFICIPYRSHITHKYAFFFRTSRRSNKSKSGLDYSKISIIKKLEYLTSKDAVIDADEYTETRLFIKKIEKDAIAYVDDYVNHISGKECLTEKEFERRYGYSTLKYFHKELGLGQCSNY